MRRSQAHSEYFEPGSEALENMVDVVTGQYSEVVRHHAALPEIAGGLVAWLLRMPACPVRMAGRHYRGPGYRLFVNWCRLVDLGASETGNLVTEVLDESERALLWVAHRVGALPDPAPSTPTPADAAPSDDRHRRRGSRPRHRPPLELTRGFRRDAPARRAPGPTLVAMDVVVSDEARAFAAARGGVVYVRSHSAPLLLGPDHPPRHVDRRAAGFERVRRPSRR